MVEWNKMFCCLITIRRNPSFDGSKTLYVFASHSHADHYDQQSETKEQYKDIHYILSDDIKDNEDAVVMKHMKKEVAGIEIETFKRSNDMGVAFLVKVEGKTIYHAGSAEWHWNGEPEEDNEYYKKTFQDEMKYLEEEDRSCIYAP